MYPENTRKGLFWPPEWSKVKLQNRQNNQILVRRVLYNLKNKKSLKQDNKQEKTKTAFGKKNNIAIR